MDGNSEVIIQPTHFIHNLWNNHISPYEWTWLNAVLPPDHIRKITVLGFNAQCGIICNNIAIEYLLQILHPFCQQEINLQWNGEWIRLWWWWWWQWWWQWLLTPALETLSSRSWLYISYRYWPSSAPSFPSSLRRRKMSHMWRTRRENVVLNVFSKWNTEQQMQCCYGKVGDVNRLTER